MVQTPEDDAYRGPRVRYLGTAYRMPNSMGFRLSVMSAAVFAEVACSTFLPHLSAGLVT